MKKLFLSLLLCLCCVLCACGDAGSISPDHDNAQGVHSNDTQSDETGEDSPHSSTSSEGSADGDASGTFVPSENAVKALDMKTAESFFGSKAMQNLFVAGYEADIVSRSITDENNVLYSVEFTNRESGENTLWKI